MISLSYLDGFRARSSGSRSMKRRNSSTTTNCTSNNRNDTAAGGSEPLLGDDELELDNNCGGEARTLELDSLRLSSSFILQPVVDGNNSNKPTTVRNSLNSFNVLHDSFLLASSHLARDLQRAAFPPFPSSDQTEEEDVRKLLLFLFLFLPSHNLPGGLEGP
jgi:hypothetical protein